MNPNHHRQPPPQSLDQEYQAAVALLNQYSQAPGGPPNSLPSTLTASLSPQVSNALHVYHHQQLQLRQKQQQQQQQQQQQLQHQQHPQSQQLFGPQGTSQQLPQFYRNPQIPGNAAINRFAQNQRTGQSILSGNGPMPSGFANLTPDQIRSFLSDNALNTSSSHSGAIPFNPSPIAASRLPPNQQNPNQHLMSTAPALLPNEPNLLIAHVQAAKSGRLSNDAIEMLYRKLGADVFRSASLGHLLDPAGNLVLPHQGPQNPQQVSQMPRPSDFPSHSMGAASGINAQAPSAQISGPSSGSYPSSAAPSSVTPQPHPSHATSAPHSRQQSHQALNHSQLFHQQPLSHPAHNLQQSHQPSQPQSQHIHIQQQQQQLQQQQSQGQIHSRQPSSQQQILPVEIDEAVLSDVKRQLQTIHQLFSQVNHLTCCLNENVVNPNEPQSHQRTMSAEERNTCEQELLKARFAHHNLNNAFKQVVEKHGGLENLQLLLKAPPTGQGQNGTVINPPAGLHAPQQPRPQSSNSQQVPGSQGHPNMLSLPGHSAHLRNQHPAQHLPGLTSAQQQPPELHQSSSHSNHAFQQNSKSIYQQQLPQQAVTPHQPAPSSFSASPTPQQTHRQPSQGVFSSPTNSSATTSNFPNHQLQHPITFHTGSPRAGVAGSVQPPRPPSALQSSTYPSTSSSLAQGSPSNATVFHQPPVFNIGSFLNGFTPDKFLAATRDSFVRKGVLWTGPPAFRGKELDLFKLFTICVIHNGFERVSATGSWGVVAAKMDLGLNPTENNDLQSVGKELCEIYRVFCLDLERAIFAAIHKQQQEHIKRNQPQSVGQSPLQGPNQQVSQGQTPQNNSTPQIQLHQPDHNLTEPRSQQGLSDGPLQNSQAINQSDNIDKELTGASQPPLSHFQGSSQAQQSNFNANQPLSMPRDHLPQRAAQVHLENRLSANSQSRVGSNEHLMVRSDDQLRELQLSEEAIMKIRQAQAQMQGKFHPPNSTPSLPPQSSQLPPTVTGASGWLSSSLPGLNSAAEERMQNFGTETNGSILARSSLNGTSLSKMNETATALDMIKTECLGVAQSLLSSYQQTNIQELTAADKEQYKNRMDELAAMFESVYQRLPDLLLLTKRHDLVRHVIVNAIAFRMAHNAFRKNEFFLASSEMLSIRSKVEAIRSFVSAQLQASLSSPQARPASQPPFQSQQHQLASQAQQQEPQKTVPHFHTAQPHEQSPAQANDLSNLSSAQAVPPPVTSHSPHFGEHLKPGIRVEDLRQPRPKRIKTGPGSTIVTSPDRPQTARVPSPTAPELFHSQQAVDASGVQHAHDSVSPGTTNLKSPISRGSTKRIQSSRGANNRGGRKSSTQIARSASKPSHQIMAEVKAELAAAKAKQESEKLDQGQFLKPGTPSATQPESNGNQSETTVNATAAPGIEGSNAQSDMSKVPAAFAESSSLKQQTESAQNEKPPQMLVEDLLKEFYSDSFSSGLQRSTSTNTADDDSWRGLVADLKLPIGIEADDEIARARENEILSSWLLDEEIVRPKSSPGLGDMGNIDMMYVGPALANFFQRGSPTEANSSKNQSKTDSRAHLENATFEPKEGLSLTHWKRESMSDFAYEATQSIFGGQEELSPSATGDGKARPCSSGQKCMTGTMTDTPEFSPSKLSNDSTPESVCSTDGANAKRPVNINPINKATVQTNVSTDGACYSNMEDDDTLLMYMMGFDDESSIGVPHGSNNRLSGASRLRVRQGSGGFTGLGSQSALSDAFWDRPFMSSASGADINKSNQIKSDDKVNHSSSSGDTSGAGGQTKFNNTISNVTGRPGENQEALTVK